jgi:DNA invertase Pin-like site-specific DNA recombinase
MSGCLSRSEVVSTRRNNAVEGVKLGRGSKKDGERSADEERAELEKRILRLHKGGTGILKIGKALGIGTGTVQRVLMEQPRPFDVGDAEAAFASQ